MRIARARLVRFPLNGNLESEWSDFPRLFLREVVMEGGGGRRN